jgi:uracil-DNA glycosylase family 4
VSTPRRASEANLKVETGRVDARAELSDIVRSLGELVRGRAEGSRGEGGGGRPRPGRGAAARAGARPQATAAPAARDSLGAGRDSADSTSGRAERTVGVARARAGAGAHAPGLEELRREASGCTRCALHQTRRNVVFGAGTGSTRILFVGEAPGRDEDAQGLPFVGRAGQLLTRIIKAIEFDREDVYIANVLKCRPPNNRNPLPEEVARCRPFLLRQIELLRPKVICTLGLFATQTLLDTTSPLTVLRGQVHKVNGLTVIPTYHPAACLRNPRLKEAVWEDVKLLRGEYLS